MIYFHVNIKTTEFGIAAAKENNFDSITDLFQDEIDDYAEQYFSEHQALLNDDQKVVINWRQNLKKKSRYNFHRRSWGYSKKTHQINLIL